MQRLLQIYTYKFILTVIVFLYKYLLIYWEYITLVNIDLYKQNANKHIFKKTQIKLLHQN